VDSDLSIRQIALTLGCESLTVKRHAVRLELPFPRLGPRTASKVPAGRRPPLIIKKREIKRRRKAWIVALTDAKTVKGARISANADYAWLYRHDRTWLGTKHRQMGVVNSERISSIDWKARQKLLSNRLNSAVAIILGQPFLRNATLTGILHELDATKHRQQLHLMPKLQNRLAMITKSNIL